MNLEDFKFTNELTNTKCARKWMQRVYCTQEGLKEMARTISKWPDPELFGAVKAEETKYQDSENKDVAVEIRDEMTDEITTQEVEGKSLGANWEMKDALSDSNNSNEDRSPNKLPNAKSLMEKEKRRRRKAERGTNNNSGESSESEGYETKKIHGEDSWTKVGKGSLTGVKTQESKDGLDHLFNMSEDGFSPHFGTDSEDEKRRFYERKKKMKRAYRVYTLNADNDGCCQADAETGKEYMKPQTLTQTYPTGILKKC